MEKETWFTKQLQQATKEAETLPDWARKEAGLKPLFCQHEWIQAAGAVVCVKCREFSGEETY